jgi:3-mercaptopyruvate sulfurtransferase SseA
MLKIKSILLYKGQSNILLLLLGLALSVTSCGTENDLASGTTSSGTALSVAKVADIAQSSADNYDDNVNGLITGNTLKSWITDWTNNRPAGITGKLIILQASAGEAGYEFIKPDGNNVFTYSVSRSEWKETRSNGVIETISMVPSGRTMDTFLAKYGIDPGKDMIVCGQGTAGAFNTMLAGRCWYMFRYWGTPKQNLAQINGGNKWLGTGTNTSLVQADFGISASIPPLNGTTSVKDLSEINMALQATLEDMLAAVPAQDVNLLNDGVFIWDARGNGMPGTGDNEYRPDGDTDFRKRGSTQGHPNGALTLVFKKLLNTSEGFTYKTKAEIQSYLDGNVDTNSVGFMGADLQTVGAGAAYQTGDVVYTYCETTYRAMVTGFATGVIIGLPTRFYDGAMYEWHSMSNVVASDGNVILPWDSPWRTDESNISMFRVHSTAASIAPRNINDAYASSANAIISEDLAYKGYTVGNTTTTTSSGGSSGDGSSAAVLPPNPCGG